MDLISVMEDSDELLLENRDWDPLYLSSIFDSDFCDHSNLWINDMGDQELVGVVEHLETYCPEVEDISLGDSELCSAVEHIENE